MVSLLTLCGFREIKKSSSGLIQDPRTFVVTTILWTTFMLLVTNFGEFTTDAFIAAPNAVCAKVFSRYSSSWSSGFEQLYFFTKAFIFVRLAPFLVCTNKLNSVEFELLPECEQVG